MKYRALDQIDELEQASALETAIWGLDPRDAAPVALLRALTHAGGLLLGAYDGAQIVGIALAFPARTANALAADALPTDRWILWSHFTGVDRRYQARGVGFELKQVQREWALANGYDEIRWTFDPLQRGNANFNIHRLGAVASDYHLNFYGVMLDEINHADSPSDRIEAVWRLRDPRVEQRLSQPASAAPSASFGAPPDCPFLLSDSAGVPLPAPLDESQPAYLVQIPPKLAASANGLTWRLALRAALTTAFAHGYTAVDFTSANAYLLRRL